VVHTRPIGVVWSVASARTWHWRENFPRNQKHLVAPASVVVGIHVKYWRDKGADVPDADGLGLQVYDGGGLMIQEGASWSGWQGPPPLGSDLKSLRSLAKEAALSAGSTTASQPRAVWASMSRA
jgi:hypothetical protein